MRTQTARPLAPPAVDSEILAERLANVRGALGASRLGMARRLTVADAPSGADAFELLAAVDAEGIVDEPEQHLPLAAFRRLLDEPRLLEVDAEATEHLGRWLRDHDLGSLRGWPLPRDRAVSVLAVATFAPGRTLAPARWNVAREGLEALARALAPPQWAPLARRADPPVAVDHRADADVERHIVQATGSDVLPLRDAIDLMERIMIQRALQCSEGNKTEAARTLQVSRQGLYKKLRRHGFV